MTFTRTLAAALAAAALAVPAAQAHDIHASLAQANADAQQRQDLRSVAARDASADANGQDLRRMSADGRPVNAPGATAVDSATRPAFPGPPTWPVNPQPIDPAPVVHASDTGGGVDWSTMGLALAAGLLAVGGIVGIAVHSRRVGRARIAA